MVLVNKQARSLIQSDVDGTLTAKWIRSWLYFQIAINDLERLFNNFT